MGTTAPGPVVLDASALIASERNDPRVRTLVAMATAAKRTLHVPAGAVAQVWRDGARHARLAHLVASPTLVVHPLDLSEAQGAGVLCGRHRTTDVVDASVVLLARRLRARVLTSDPDDLRALDPTLAVVPC